MGDKKPTYEELEKQVRELQAEARDLKNDASERKQAEEAQRESEEKHRILFESSRDAIMTLAPPSWRFTKGNPATVKLFGTKDESEFASLGPWELSPEKQPDGRPSAEKAKEMIETAMRDGSNFFEWTHRKLNGEEFPATVLLTRMKLGEKILLQATVRDITEQKRAEEELKDANEQLLQAQKIDALGILAGGIAHDFNNILATILGTAEILLRKTDDGDPNVPRIKRILKSGKRAKDLTMKMLTLARKEKLNIKTVSIDNIISDVLAMLKSSISKNIKIEARRKEGVLNVAADTNQIVQALLNICINACDSMPVGGVLSVETTDALLDEAWCKANTGVSPGKYCVVQISDTGTGIQDEIRDKIFEPFFTTKSRGEGSGLGLSITLGIIKNHDGAIDICSEPGTGTSVKIYLPVTDTPEETIDTDVVAEIKGNEEIILIVDDDKDFADMLKEALEMLRYRVIVALSGRAAIENYKKRHEEVDLVILDMLMLEMDGSEVFQALRKIEPDVKVILCSGYSVDGMVSELIGAGAETFIQKPFDVAELSLIISSKLDADG